MPAVTATLEDEFRISCGNRGLSVQLAGITYMLLSRCGLHPERFLGPDDFANMYKFNAFRSVLALGTAVSKCAGAVLPCIETAIRKYEKAF